MSNRSARVIKLYMRMILKCIKYMAVTILALFVFLKYTRFMSILLLLVIFMYKYKYELFEYMKYISIALINRLMKYIQRYRRSKSSDLISFAWDYLKEFLKWMKTNDIKVFHKVKIISSEGYVFYIIPKRSGYKYNITVRVTDNFLNELTDDIPELFPMPTEGYPPPSLFHKKGKYFSLYRKGELIGERYTKINRLIIETAIGLTRTHKL